MSKGVIVFLAVNASYSHTNLAGWYLRGLAEAAGWTWREVEIIQNESLASVLQRVLRLKPDVIAASFYLFNANFLLSLLSRFRAIRPSCPVIGGGPEFLGDNFSFLQRHPEINAVIRGEGERAFADWLKGWQKPEEWGKIKGLCAIIDGHYLDNGKAELMENLDDIPSPYEHNLIYRSFEMVGPHSLVRPRIPARNLAATDSNAGGSAGQGCPALPDGKIVPMHENRSALFKKPFLLFETSRGCSNQCAFCTSAGTQVRFFPLERVQSDLSLISAAGVKEVRIADRTFNENSARCLELIKIMRAEFRDIRFHLEIDPARVSDVMIRELALAGPGRFHLEVGIQCLQAETQKKIGRSGPVERALAVLDQLCFLRNLAIHVDLMAGLPGVTLADLQADLRQIALMQPDEIQLELLKVLPGTRLSKEREKFGIIAAGEPPYEVLQTADMSQDDLVIAQRLSNLMDWFYNAPALQPSFIAAVKLVPAFFERFNDFCGKLAGESHAPALENRFRLLEQFCRLNEPALIPKLGYEWLKWGLSAQHGIYPAKPWKKPLPAGAVLVEDDGGAAQFAAANIYLVELERPYLFVYGKCLSRGATAIYAL